jgi:hypothetical protein
MDESINSKKGAPKLQDGSAVWGGGGGKEGGGGGGERGYKGLKGESRVIVRLKTIPFL